MIQSVNTFYGLWCITSEEARSVPFVFLLTHKQFLKEKYTEHISSVLRKKSTGPLLILPQKFSFTDLLCKSLKIVVGIHSFQNLPIRFSSTA